MEAMTEDEIKRLWLRIGWNVTRDRNATDDPVPWYQDEIAKLIYTWAVAQAGREKAEFEASEHTDTQDGIACFATSPFEPCVDPRHDFVAFDHWLAVVLRRIGWKEQGE